MGDTGLELASGPHGGSYSPCLLLGAARLAGTACCLRSERRAIGSWPQQFKRFGDRLAKQKIAERNVLQIASELWPDNGTVRQIHNAQARRDAVLRLFSEGATIGNAPGTKWCAANALLEQLEWGSGARSPEGRFLRHTSDQGGLKARALELVLDA